jgi:thiamine-monophosphate kinase
MSEAGRIARLSRIFGAQGFTEGELGIGDDAAVVLPGADSRLVWTIDAQVEGVHFRREWLSWKELGYRSFVAAASDVSAMGGAPWRALSALTLPPAFTDEQTDEIARGQKEAANHTSAPVVGGNLSKGDVVTITTSVLGKAKNPISRSGAQEGDSVWVSGAVGLAGAGLRALLQGRSGEALDSAIEAWRTPTPRVSEGLLMADLAHAAIDVSDGLALDASRVADASGVAVVLEEEPLLSHAGEILARAASALEASALDLVLGGGEDYALVATSALPIPGFTRIGHVREGRGLYLRNKRGERELREIPGYDHFR